MHSTSKRCEFGLQRHSRRFVNLHSGSRTAFTLIELLVVIAILLILLAVALPAIGLGTNEKRTREASRKIKKY